MKMSALTFELSQTDGSFLFAADVSLGRNRKTQPNGQTLTAQVMLRRRLQCHPRFFTWRWLQATMVQQTNVKDLIG